MARLAGVAATLVGLSASIYLAKYPTWANDHPHMAIGVYLLTGFSVLFLVFPLKQFRSLQDSSSTKITPEGVNASAMNNDNRINQSMSNSPGAYQVAGDLTVQGRLDPPPRIINSQSFESAVATLRTATPGSTVGFQKIGASAEIDSYADQIVGLFRAASPVWTIKEMSAVVSYTNTVVLSGRILVDRGEGLGYTARNPASEAVTIALRALSEAGCSYSPHTAPPQSRGTDIFLSIGTRFVEE